MPADLAFRKLLLDIENDTDCSYLIEILESAKLYNLAFKVARFENRNSPPTPPPPTLEDHQPRENIHTTTISTTNSYQQQIPTMQELYSDFNEDDSMVIIDYEPNDQTSLMPTIVEPESPIALLSVENIDLKIFESGLWSVEFLQKINVNIPLYEYQRELVQSAIQAKNTIICLRTGGGKTVVAALLIKYYLIKKMATTNESNKKFLAFFIVPRRAMLKQQLEKLKQFTKLRVAQCEEYSDLTQHIDHYDIIVSTPQKLLNCLKAKTMFLSDIDLICFDECHDVAAQNQYVGIMQYLMCKKIDSIPPVDAPPIIIGLTAGFFSSNSGSVPGNLIRLCATFNCSTITTVMKKENDEELERYVHHISEDEIICVDKQKSFDALRLSIKKDLEDLILQLFLSKETNPLQIFPEKDFDMNGYEQNLELLKQSEQKSKIFHLSSLIDLTPQLVLSDLKDYFDIRYKRREHPIKIDTLIYERCRNLLQKKLTELEESQQTISNPKLDKLVEVLKKHTETPNSRAIILVERAFYATKICEFLRNHSDLKSTIKPCWLARQHTDSSKKPNKKEDSVLKDFQIGNYNVLVSTDVVQAGLDIPQCSLVLRYDFVPDSIGTIQARVRARTIDCKYYLITTKDSSNYEKERENRDREQALKESLDTWKRYPSEQFKERVIETQTSLTDEWTRDLTKTLTSKTNVPKATDLNGEILCRACGYVLGPLTSLRQRGEAYFINEHDFYNRIEEKMYPEPEEYGGTIVTGKALCGSKICRVDLGRIQVLKNHPKFSPIYPLKCAAIKIRQIENETGRENIILKKKWTLMPFTVPPLEMDSTNNNEDSFYDTYDDVSTDLSHA